MPIEKLKGLMTPIDPLTRFTNCKCFANYLPPVYILILREIN